MNHIIFIVALSLLSCGITFVLTPLFRRLSHRLGFVDKPDHLRKVHSQPGPRIGGAAIFSGILGAVGILTFFEPVRTYMLGDAVLVRLIPAVLLVFVTGLLDDIFGLKPWQKIAGQIAAAGVACAAGAQINMIAGRHVVHPWQIPITILWLVGCTN